MGSIDVFFLSVGNLCTYLNMHIFAKLNIPILDASHFCTISSNLVIDNYVD